MIKLWNQDREKQIDIYQHWLTVAQELARCNMDQLESKQIESELQIAIYLTTVKEVELEKQLWEKRDNKDILEKFIKAAVEAEREFDKVQKKPSEVKIKEEPVG